MSAANMGKVRMEMDYKSGEIVSNGLAGLAYTGSYDTKESVAHGIAVLKGRCQKIRRWKHEV